MTRTLTALAAVLVLSAWTPPNPTTNVGPPAVVHDTGGVMNVSVTNQMDDEVTTGAVMRRMTEQVTATTALGNTVNRRAAAWVVDWVAEHRAAMRQVAEEVATFQWGFEGGATDMGAINMPQNAVPSYGALDEPVDTPQNLSRMHTQAQNGSTATIGIGPPTCNPGSACCVNTANSTVMLN